MPKPFDVTEPKTVAGRVKRNVEDARRRGLVRIGTLASVLAAAGIRIEWLETATRSTPRRLAPPEYRDAPKLRPPRRFFGKLVPYWKQRSDEEDKVTIPVRQAWATPEQADAAHATANAGMRDDARGRVALRILHEPGMAEAIDAVRRLGNPEALRSFLRSLGKAK